MDARRFHELTKHTPASIRRSRHLLDWSNKPYPFKEYVDLEPIPLPSPSSDTSLPATDAIVGHAPDARRSLDLSELARLLVLGAGVLRERVFPDGERFYFRTYASAGALYPVEVYVACAGIDQLAPGLYHFHPRETALRQLATNDPRAAVVAACGGRDSLAAAPIALVLTGIPWRTTWKYEARGYRHIFWDAGMIIVNFLALAASGGHPAEVIAGFADDDLNALVGIDGRTEMALAVVPVGDSGERTALPASEARLHERPQHAVAPLSRQAREYPEPVAVHAAGVLAPDDVASWQRSSAGRSKPPQDSQCQDGVETVIRRRGSSRAFSRASIPGEQLTDVLLRAMHDLHSDWDSSLVELVAIVNGANGISSGAYRLDGGRLQMVAAGDFRDVGYWLCLEQPLGGDGAATVFLLADLERVSSDFGSRGYRAAQLEAGIRAGRLYLGAYACGFGATGLTFYDDEVRKFFDTDLEPMLAVALGRPARGRRLL
ncbi:MAG: SagB/ThcOx family dehydrogenase [Actinomycetota bacterium]|nr:SagB/ThcOx family dehydrogenase [Actinomycetota bacterium]